MLKKLLTTLMIILSGCSIETKAMNAIDFHTHPIPESYKQGLSDMEIDLIETDEFPLHDWSAENHIKFMNEAGINLSILSIPAPHINNGDNEKSRKYVRLINEIKEIL